MAEETIITWNVPNWITVCLMALIGFGLFGLAMRVVKKRSTTDAGA